MCWATFASALLLSIVIWSSAARAADDNGKFAIRGAGLQTCSGAVNAFDTSSPDLALYAGWIDGYLTGVNQFREDTFEMAPWQTANTLLALTVEVCRNEADDVKFMAVFVRLLRDFSAARLRAETPLTGVFRGSQRLALYATTIEAVERTLLELGHDPGEVDGVFTEETSDALVAFQTDRQIQTTGLPDQQTLFALFVRSGSAPGSE